MMVRGLEGYYSTFQYNNAHAVSIPKSAADPEKTALLTAAYEMFAHTTILPAYYDYTLTLRAARDNESGEMLELIFANRNLDVALGRECCRWYAGVIARWTEGQLAYPEA